MNYKNRSLESKLKLYWKNFPCVLVAGSRQVGKSTLIRHLFEKEAKLFTFDPLQDLFGEKSDPDLFLENNPAPLILDEIQYVPQLVPSIKRFVDRDRRPGMYLMTGSQQWEVMRHLSESMAGRVATLEINPFSLPEINEEGESPWFSSWIQRAMSGEQREADEWLLSGKSRSEPLIPQIWKGMFPEVQTLQRTIERIIISLLIKSLFQIEQQSRLPRLSGRVDHEVEFLINQRLHPRKAFACGKHVVFFRVARPGNIKKFWNHADTLPERMRDGDV